MEKTALFDNHGRKINYLRLAVTDRCNLRCFYCMPEEGIKYIDKSELMTYEEMHRIIRILANLGIEKIRITGGEPFVRRDMLSFMESISQIPGINQLHLTTNGTLTPPLVPALKAMNIKSVNLSLDSLDEKRFFEITRRDVFKTVMETFDQLLAHQIPTKMNMVVIDGKNIEDIIPMAMLSKDHPVSVRYIEEMPFNGGGDHYPILKWNHKKILELLTQHFPNIEKIPDPAFSTSNNYKIPGHQGTVGIIPAYSRTFCGSCNRIRITPQGMLKTCLYDDGVFNIRNILRAGASDEQIEMAFLQALGNRAKDGFEAENRRTGRSASESMATIGG